MLPEDWHVMPKSDLGAYPKPGKIVSVVEDRVRLLNSFAIYGFSLLG